MQERRQVNDCIHVLHRRSDRRSVSDIANQNFYVLREHALGRSIERKGADLITGLVRRVDNARPNGAGSAGY